MKCIKKTLLFFSCFVWTQQLLSLSTLSLWNNINKKTTLKRNKQESLYKISKKPKRYKNKSSTSLRRQEETDCSKNTYEYNTDNPTDFQCDFLKCKKTFAKLWMLNKHKQTHITEKNYKCRYCKKLFTVEDYLIRHKNEHHNPNKDFKCKICNYTYSTENSLLYHSNTHLKRNPNPFFCLICSTNLSYISKENLTRHTKLKHSYYKCKDKDCNKSFMRGSLLHQHIKEQHGFSPIPCPECPRSFHGKLILYQHRYMSHEKYDKNTFIEFLKDFIKNDLSYSYPFYQEHPFFHSLFLEKEVLKDSLLSNLETIDISEIPIETLPLYEEFIKNIKSDKCLPLKKLSLDVLFSYECYRLYFSHDSAIGLLFLKDILSIMIENRKPLETTYKEMLDRLYRKQFTDEEYLLFIKEFRKVFFKKFASSDFLQGQEKDGLRTERSVIDKKLVHLNIALQESLNPKQLDNQSGVPKEYLLPHEQVGIGGVFPSVNTVFKKNADTIVGSPVAKTSEYDFNNIENDLNNLNDSHQGNPFSFEENHEVRTPYNVIGRQA